ncbi:hypothetical protein ACJX0J_029701, partial [Zea mays]
MDPSKILIWNVRGLNSRAHQDSVRELALRRFYFEAFWPKLEGFHDIDEIKDFRKNFIATLAAATEQALLPSDKAPGPDGFTGGFYNGLSESLGASFRNSFTLLKTIVIVVFLMFDGFF